MKKQKHTNVLGVVLLFLYVLSIAPSLIYHHHHNNKVVAFSEADTCEKAIYYGIQDKHEQHISKTQERCWLCDHHTTTPQILSDTRLILPKNQSYTEYFYSYQIYYSVEKVIFFNKGPPNI